MGDAKSREAGKRDAQERGFKQSTFQNLKTVTFQNLKTVSIFKIFSLNSQIYSVIKGGRRNTVLPPYHLFLNLSLTFFKCHGLIMPLIYLYLFFEFVEISKTILIPNSKIAHLTKSRPLWFFLFPFPWLCPSLFLCFLKTSSFYFLYFFPHFAPMSRFGVR